MRKVVVYELLSLDGVAEQPDAFFTDWDETMRENLRRVIATQDTVLLGRRTYDEWAAFWPPSHIEPFASFINGVEKFVATSSSPTQTWANTTVIDGGLADFVTELKRKLVVTSGSTAASLSHSRCSKRAWSTNSGSSSPRPCRCTAASSSTGGHRAG